MTAARALLGIVLAASLAAGAGRAGTRGEAGAAQALRTCVDRWNQANMLDWGPAEASVAVRRLHPGELQYLAQLARPGCVVALAVEFPKDPRQGCYGGKTVPGHPQLCIDRRTTNICAPTSPRTGAYYCTTRSDGAPALANRNATTDGRGSLTLDVPLAGTHPTPPLAWQRYPHRDGYIWPWLDGRLRPGLRLHGNARGLGCAHVQEWTPLKSAIRCLRRQDYIEPCFPPRKHWHRRGTVIACGGPGTTSFLRFTITK